MLERGKCCYRGSVSPGQGFGGPPPTGGAISRYADAGSSVGPAPGPRHHHHAASPARIISRPRLEYSGLMSSRSREQRRAASVLRRATANRLQMEICFMWPQKQWSRHAPDCNISMWCRLHCSCRPPLHLHTASSAQMRR